jgi:hypothetical protein
MSARDPLPTLAAAGLSVGLDADGALLIGPRDRLTDELRALIREHRAELLASLTLPASVVPRTVQPELLRLLAEVGDRYGCTAEERAEMAEAAARDPEGASRSFRSILAERRPEIDPDASMPDIRRTCRECAHRRGLICSALSAGAPPYVPPLDMRQRCPSYRGRSAEVVRTTPA